MTFTHPPNIPYNTSVGYRKHLLQYRFYVDICYVIYIRNNDKKKVPTFSVGLVIFIIIATTTSAWLKLLDVGPVNTDSIDIL